MDLFSAIVFGTLAASLLVFLLLGRAWQGRPIADTTDKRANEKWAAQLQIEQHDIPEMLAAANEYRRKRGLREITAQEFNDKLEAEQVELLHQAEKQLRAQRNDGGADRERRGF